MNKTLLELADFWDRLAAKIREESKTENDHEGLVTREEASILEDCARLVRGVLDGSVTLASMATHADWIPKPSSPKRPDGTYPIQCDPEG